MGQTSFQHICTSWSGQWQIRECDVFLTSHTNSLSMPFETKKALSPKEALCQSSFTASGHGMQLQGTRGFEREVLPPCVLVNCQN